jgi:hypothetical protein
MNNPVTEDRGPCTCGGCGLAFASLFSFDGCEINPEYFDIACERIERAHDQYRLFA